MVSDKTLDTILVGRVIKGYSTEECVRLLEKHLYGGLRSIEDLQKYEDCTTVGGGKIGEYYGRQGFKEIPGALKDLKIYFGQDPLNSDNYKITDISKMSFKIEEYHDPEKRGAFVIGFADRDTGKLKYGVLLKRSDLEYITSNLNDQKSKYRSELVETAIEKKGAYALTNVTPLTKIDSLAQPYHIEYRLARIEKDEFGYKMLIDGIGYKPILLGGISDHPLKRLVYYQY